MQIKFWKAITLALAILVSGCGSLPEEYDETRGWSANKLYSEAHDELKSGNYTKGIQYLEKLEARYPFGTYAQQAQLDIAYAYYKQGEQAQALAAVERFIKLYPNHSSIDYVYYLRGLIHFNDRVGLFNFLAPQDPSERDPKAAREAFESFRQVTERFPNSTYAKDSLDRMRYLVNNMAQHEVHVASYYYRRGAYLAAANRAQIAVKEYRDAPALEDALIIMVRSYDALGLKTLRDDAETVLRTNFPDSAYFQGGKARNTSAWWKFW